MMYRNERLSDCSPELERLLLRDKLPPARFSASEITCLTVMVAMRDGTRLATDLYLPPLDRAPAVAMRTPYGRSMDASVGAFVSLARRGYAAVSQDCRGTGESEPDNWDYYMYEVEDSQDLVEWITRQHWFDGFIGSCGGSYVGQTQWCMATHPAMSTTVPQVSGLGIASNTGHLYMWTNAYARVVGKGERRVDVSIYDMEQVFAQETLSAGYFNETLHRSLPEALLARFPELRGLSPAEAQRGLWQHYCTMTGSQRAHLVRQAMGVRNVSILEVESLSAVFGQRISHDALTIPHPSPPELCRLIKAPPLMLTGWYDWCLNDALETWQVLRREGEAEVRERARLVIGPHSHNMPGYHEGMDLHPELLRMPSMPNFLGLLLRWYAAVREGRLESWPRVIYYLMGANEWRAAADWPVPQATQRVLYLDADEALIPEPPRHDTSSDSYIYDPNNPTPTMGGSIVSFVYPPGSVDVREAQDRPDVLVYTTTPFECDLDVVGPLRVILYASSSAVDTDFVARLTDVFPDGRAIQLQSNLLRARYRNLDAEPALLRPDEIYRFEIDLWGTATRFKAGHRLRVDISSADFPRFDRNSNLGGEPGNGISAQQTIYHDRERPSQLLFYVLAPLAPEPV